jgi:peptidoglycan/xylan/chitin deacetylase (PgdA/CDA1 family)
MREGIQRLKYIAKHGITYLLYYSGILFFVKHISLRNKAVVLTYHRILPYELRDLSFSHSAIMVEPENFDRQLAFIKRNFTVVNSSTLAAAFETNQALPDAACLITFDDGWQDNYQYAFPILKKHALSAIIFPATDYIESGSLFWQEAMGHGFRHLLDVDSEEARTFLHEHGLYQLKHENDRVRFNAIRDYVRKLKPLSYDELEHIMASMHTMLGNIDCGDIDCYLNWQQISEMHDYGIEFGSHACSHRVLTRLDDQTVKQELEQSRQLLEQAIGEQVNLIAYPNGNYNDHLGELTRDAGYKIGFGTRFGHVTSTDNPLDIKRINIYDMTATNNPVMLATILGIF